MEDEEKWREKLKREDKGRGQNGERERGKHKWREERGK